MARFGSWGYAGVIPSRIGERVVSEAMYQAERKTSKTEELLARLQGEVERQALAIDNITRVTEIASFHGPENEFLEPVKEIPQDSKLVITLRDLLLGFERNTNRINNLADRIEL